MSDRQSIIGFTEAELGIFLAMAALLLMASQARSHRSKNEGASDSTLVAVSTLASLRLRAESVPSLRQARDSALLRLNRLQDSSKRSRMTPTCNEKEVARSPLFTLTLSGPDQFSLDGNIITFSAVRARWAPDWLEASKNGCRHVVWLYFNESVPSRLLVEEAERLRSLAYVSVRGPR